MFDLLLFLALSVAALAATQAASLALVARRLRRARGPARTRALPPITLLRPVCGLEHALEETLRSSFRLEAEGYEIVFCIARPDDPAAPLLRRLIAEHPGVPARLLVGDDRDFANPKLNNLLKGWRAARHDWIVMADSNLMLPPDYLQRLVAAWTPGTGLVSSPATGADPQGLWAALEAAFLNTHQARWQLLADEIGQGHAQGKTLFWRRDILDAAGGLAALAGELAEDIAATELVRRRGLAVRIVPAAFVQPLGRRRPAQVWRRQLRWARLRRMGVPALYAAEALCGALPPAMLTAALAGAGVAPWAALPLLLGAWYGAEAALAAAAGWPHGPRDLVAWMLRDLLLPALWVAGWTGSGVTWHGHALRAPGRHGRRGRRGARRIGHV